MPDRGGVREGVPGCGHRRGRPYRRHRHRTVPRRREIGTGAADPPGGVLVSGLLIALDGPGGAGKSSMTGQLVAALTGAGAPVWATTEPSHTELGQLARRSTDTYSGLAFACLIAADRYH